MDMIDLIVFGFNFFFFFKFKLVLLWPVARGLRRGIMKMKHLAGLSEALFNIIYGYLKTASI